MTLIGLVVLLAYTFFALRHIEVDFRTSKNNVTVTNQEIIDAGDIDMGGTVFFRDKEKYVQNIEEEYPYIKVINIETVFPNKFVIHVAERQEVYALEGEDYFYVCDEELRVLRISDNLDFSSTTAISLKGDFSLNNIKVGEYITQIQNPMLYQKLFECNRDIGAQNSLISQIEMTTEFDEGLQDEIDLLKISLRSGQKVLIANYKNALANKCHLFLEVYSKLFDLEGKASKQRDGSDAVLTYENLQTCEIYINNYYTDGENLTLNGENCYFKIFVSP